MNDKIKRRHQRDEEQASEIENIVEYPLDIPSLERQLWHSYDLGDEPFLSDGYDWTDKPHRAMDKAIGEIRALRSYIIDSRSDNPSEESLP